jgi:REP element-mobilizing transposase RayT
MTNCFHVCFTSHKEVIFRSFSDYVFGVFAMVLAAIRSKSVILAFALMSDHVHVAILSSSYSTFVSLFRNSYNRHFNMKYLRTGPLGERGFYYKPLIGTNHIVAAISYVLRNPIHHGICKSPFEYEFTSSTCYFNKFFCRKLTYFPTRMGIREMEKKGLLSRNSIAEIPDEYRFDENGQLCFNDFVDIPFVENHYVSGRRFSYYMTRPSNDGWAQEQMKDIEGSHMTEEEYLAFNPPISINSIEPDFSIDDMLKQESGNFHEKRILDIEVCGLIDNEYVPKYHLKSYAELSLLQKKEILHDIMRKYYASDRQLRRCLAIGEGE